MSFFEKNRQMLAYIGGVLTVVTTGMGATWFLSQRFERMQHQIDTLLSDRYSLTQASERALRTAIENPGMRVPDPRDPNKIILVRYTEKPSDSRKQGVTDD